MTQQAWEERYSQPDRVWSGRVNPWVRTVASELPTGSALDLACGEGADAVWLASQGWRVHAVDFAQAALERGCAAAASAGVADRITWVQSDLSAGWRPDRTFDLVTMHFLHTPDAAVREAALRAAWAATAGTLLVVAHDPANAVEGTAGGPPDPAVLYGADEVLGALGLVPHAPEVVVAESRRRVTEAGVWIDAIAVLRRRAGGASGES